MSALSSMTVPTSLQAPSAPPSAAELAKRAQIKDTAQKFEASFLSVMVNQMFEHDDDSVDKAFTGGSGAQMFKSVLAESMAKKISSRGGIGLAKPVEREMLKMQGLTV